jgi:hypothetical protein
MKTLHGKENGSFGDLLFMLFEPEELESLTTEQIEFLKCAFQKLNNDSDFREFQFSEEAIEELGQALREMELGSRPDLDVQGDPSLSLDPGHRKGGSFQFTTFHNKCEACV